MKEGKTLGQRIQEGRKAAGLSQEALGEELHVSRQAVSKWEADAATPELENLIAMSRLFGRTVGELLGVEEAVSGQAAGSAPPELTEKELAAAEAIAAKYMEAVRRESRPRWPLRQRAAALALLFLVGAAGVFLCGQLRSTGRQLTLLQQQVNGIQNDFSWEIASLAGRISDILDEKSNILIILHCPLQLLTAKASTVTLCARASAREWTNATTGHVQRHAFRRTAVHCGGHRLRRAALPLTIGRCPWTRRSPCAWPFLTAAAPAPGRSIHFMTACQAISFCT